MLEAGLAAQRARARAGRPLLPLVRYAELRVVRVRPLRLTAWSWCLAMCHTLGLEPGSFVDRGARGAVALCHGMIALNPTFPTVRACHRL